MGGTYMHPPLLDLMERLVEYVEEVIHVLALDDHRWLDLEDVVGGPIAGQHHQPLARLGLWTAELPPAS